MSATLQPVCGSYTQAIQDEDARTVRQILMLTVDLERQQAEYAAKEKQAEIARINLLARIDDLNANTDADAIYHPQLVGHDVSARLPQIDAAIRYFRPAKGRKAPALSRRT